MEYSKKKVAKLLRTKRVKLGLTQKELAEKSGVSIPTINGLENEKRNGSAKIIHKVARALDLDELDFFKD